MSDSSTSFPHLRLRLAGQGIAVPQRGGRKVSPTTSANKDDAGGHGGRLKSSVDLITANWNSEKEQRKEEGKPDLPYSVSFILEVDPHSFDADALKSFGIEVVADLEEGYIIGASADTELSELRKKIEQFINAERGGGKVPEIWELLEGTQRPEYILSDRLKEEWENLSETQEFFVDVGISCIDIREQYPRCPKRESYKTDKGYQKGIEKWLSKHNQTRMEWDNLFDERFDQLHAFVSDYNGQVLDTIEGNEISVARLPDSFSCRIRITGKGLKDLVLNFPYIFDVSEPDEFCLPPMNLEAGGDDRDSFSLEPPDSNAPRVCVIDSGIQEQHRLLRSAIDSPRSKSWVPGDALTADYVVNGGHGTRVAGAVLYPREIPTTGRLVALCWLQNARILDRNNRLPDGVFPPEVLEEIVEHYYGHTRTRIFNHSITGITPCRTQSMSAWAAAIDKLTWDRGGDLLFIVASGNLHPDLSHITRPSLAAHLQAGRSYPDYLLEKSVRVANPAQSFQALTVGSVAHITYESPPLRSLAEQDCCSSFSCTGFGIWNTIKPEVVEYGGDFVIDSDTSPSLTTPEPVCPQLVRSTLNGGGPLVSADAIGTSFSAPKVTHIAASLAATYPDDSALLYRALIVQSARLPEWTSESVEKLYHGIRTMGYGIPELDRALGNSPSRVTLTTSGTEHIRARQATVYQVQIPEFLLQQGEGIDILIEITLAYVAEPRRTRRNRRKYLSTWLDWNCSKIGEDPDVFIARVLEKYEQASPNSEEGEGLFSWTLGRRQSRATGYETRSSQGIDGRVKEASRSTGTIQKDWAIVKSYDLREGFCIAVIGHEGWNKNEEATVPYSLVVSFEAVSAEIELYEPFVQVQQQLQVREQVRLIVS